MRGVWVGWGSWRGLVLPVSDSVTPEQAWGLRVVIIASVHVWAPAGPAAQWPAT